MDLLSIGFSIAILCFSGYILWGMFFRVHARRDEKMTTHWQGLHFHREDGPAVIFKDNKHWVWYNKGKRHRDDGPAEKFDFDTGVQYTKWWNHGKIHRTDGPAYIFESQDGDVLCRVWAVDGKIHRKDGPAIEIIDLPFEGEYKFWAWENQILNFSDWCGVVSQHLDENDDITPEELMIEQIRHANTEESPIEEVIKSFKFHSDMLYGASVKSKKTMEQVRVGTRGETLESIFYRPKD